MWELRYTKHAQKDAKKLAPANLKDKAKELLEIISENPYQNPPPYEKLVGDLSGTYSRRINIQHHLDSVVTKCPPIQPDNESAQRQETTTHF